MAAKKVRKITLRDLAVALATVAGTTHPGLADIFRVLIAVLGPPA